MIEVPAGFLNVLFTLLIVFASVNRSKAPILGWRVHAAAE